MKRKGKRYDAISISLGNPGEKIVKMCPLNGFLEIYSPVATYRIQTPENLDPEETNPDMPSIARKVSDIGSSNWIVARLFLQSYEMIDSHLLSNSEKKKEIFNLLHQVKEDLLLCEEKYSALKKQVDKVEALLKSNGLNNKGNVIDSFPTVLGLNEICSMFLTKGKHTVQTYIKIFNLFYDTSVTNPRVDLVVKWIENNASAVPLVFKDLFADFHPLAKHVVDLRNSQEHPREGFSFTSSDFSLSPDEVVNAPQWGVDRDKLYPAHLEMQRILEELVSVGEGLIILLVVNSSDYSNTPFQYVVSEIDAENRDDDCPFRYNLYLQFKEKNE